MPQLKIVQEGRSRYEDDSRKEDSNLLGHSCSHAYHLLQQPVYIFTLV